MEVLLTLENKEVHLKVVIAEVMVAIKKSIGASVVFAHQAGMQKIFVREGSRLVRKQGMAVFLQVVSLGVKKLFLTKEKFF